MSTLPQEVTDFFPRLPLSTEEALGLTAPVREVTVLEDRAQISREGQIALSQGRHRLVVWEVSPLLQNVSLRAEVARGDAEVLDVRAHRAYRVRHQDQPEERRTIDAEIRALEQQFAAIADKRERTEERYMRMLDMLEKGAEEIPEDAAWGQVNHQVWHDTFETLFQRARKLLDSAVEDYFAQRNLLEERDQLATRRQALARLSHHFVACVAVDIEVAADCEVALSLHYVVPNAMWRPLHSARLANESLHLTSCATVWQHTGEDWDDAQLAFSTARSSLGTEAPLLSDDLMQAQRKRDEIIVEQREVTIQSTGPDTGTSTQAPAPQGVELPGVDDGGDLQHLKAIDRCSIPSDGQPHMIPLFSFRAPAVTRRVCMPEIEPKVLRKSTQANLAAAPLLAGPVELIQDHGLVGWSRIMFVAAQESFDLNFGPDDGVRVSRTIERESTTDSIDHWKHVQTHTRLYLSNLEATEKTITLTERIPVSEVDYVKVALDQECTSPGHTLDKNGFCLWEVTLAPHENRQLELVWTLSTAPEVQGV